jgi:hypothetical protein
MMSTASCGGLLATPEAATRAICEPTQDARQAHAGALVALGDSPEERKAKSTGVAALAGVAAGCGELGAGGVGPRGAVSAR